MPSRRARQPRPALTRWARGFTAFVANSLPSEQAKHDAGRSLAIGRRAPKVAEHLTHREARMSHVRQIMETHPATGQIDLDALVTCIEACFDCVQTCTACADACLAEPEVAALVRCAALCHSCSDLCI